MAIRQICSCPYCGKTVSYGLKVETRIFGSPFQLCTKCGKEYIDKRYIELARFRDNELKLIKQNFLETFIKDILTYLLASVLLGFFLIESLNWSITLSIIISLIFFCLIYSWLGIKPWEWNRELIASNERVIDPKYLEKLKKFSVGR